MSELPSEWNNEAYVSLHLVQEMLRMAGLPARSGYSHWTPEFKIRVPRLTKNNLVTETDKEVDFLIEDCARYINFLVEVKAANTRINHDARVQLQTYLKYSNTRFGVLIDPFSVEIYQQADAEKAIEQALLQSKLNERIIEPQDVSKFLEFINNNKSNLTLISGVKDAYAKLISNNRPYVSQEDMQKKLGAKRSLKWLRAYKQMKI
ncbi:GxxExxY protein [Nostoc sp. 'Peltigera malacea cyanobiont' DB3992]|uniref:GxxExxY protein n=2 Tax=unclassified Nostoc TaxID=2593658 RepID=UPI000C03F26B|nr:GxxExxY protein [Nostoc sp. 'Peltigera malacea cyanobiont' DB3992]PHM11182.1 hypothetical protein CK516_04165 [Nostoc sp. 'Peltigera malacea cyanobiont' DB3992]